jgi:hypothetical protein
VAEKMAINRVYLMNQTNDCFSYCSGLNNMKSELIEYFDINKYYNKASNQEIEFVNNIVYVIVFDESFKYSKTNFHLSFCIE